MLISNENGLHCLIIQLRSCCLGDMRISNWPKYLQVLHIRFESASCLNRSCVRNTLSGWSVYQIYHTCYGLNPKIIWHTFWWESTNHITFRFKHAPRHVHDCSILSLGNSVVLRCVGTCYVMLQPKFFTVPLELIRLVLTPSSLRTILICLPLSLSTNVLKILKQWNTSSLFFNK